MIDESDLFSASESITHSDDSQEKPPRLRFLKKRKPDDNDNMKKDLKKSKRRKPEIDASANTNTDLKKENVSEEEKASGPMPRRTHERKKISNRMPSRQNRKLRYSGLQPTAVVRRTHPSKSTDLAPWTELSDNIKAKKGTYTESNFEELGAYSHDNDMVCLPITEKGEISKSSPDGYKYYFLETETAKSIGNQTISTLFNDVNFCTHTREALDTRKTKGVNQFCISVVPVSVTDQNDQTSTLTLVSISGRSIEKNPHHAEQILAIEQALHPESSDPASSSAASSDPSSQYRVCSPANLGYKQALQEIADKNPTLYTKPCSEHDYLPELMKVLADPQYKDVKVLGCMNYAIKAVKEESDLHKPDVDQFSTNNLLSATAIPCCKNCQAIKPEVFSMLSYYYQHKAGSVQLPAAVCSPHRAAADVMTLSDRPVYFDRMRAEHPNTIFGFGSAPAHRRKRGLHFVFSRPRDRGHLNADHGRWLQEISRRDPEPSNPAFQGLLSDDRHHSGSTRDKSSERRDYHSCARSHQRERRDHGSASHERKRNRSSRVGNA